jgi:hypothetical protein
MMLNAVLVAASVIACAVVLWVSMTKPFKEVNRCVNQCQLQIEIVKDTPCTITHNTQTALEPFNLDLSSEVVITSDSVPLTVTHAIANFVCSESASVITCRFKNDPNDDTACIKPWDCNGQKLVLIQRAT